MQSLPSTIGVPFLAQSRAYRHRAFGPLLPEADRRAIDLAATTHPGARRIAVKLLTCCLHPVIISVDLGTRLYLAEQRCRSRVCPRCSRIRANQLAHRITELVHLMDAPRFLTLTIRSTCSPLRDQVNRLRARFAAMRRSAAWATHVTGGVYTIEITHNPDSGQWHPHLHAIIDGRFWLHSDLLATWQRVVHDHAGVDIRAVHGARKLANYLAAYVAKSCDLSRLLPRELAAWAVETHGLRLAQTFGDLHAMKPQNDPREPTINRLIDVCVNRIAYEESWGDSMAGRILATLVPAPGDPPGLETPQLTAAVLRYHRRYALIRPPPQPAPPDHQLRFAAAALSGPL